MELSDTNRKIIDAIIKKAQKVCPGSLELIGVYGSVCTGDIHEKSDLDLLILINDDLGWKLSDGFILDDKGIGYDIYCTNWKMLEEEAACGHAHLAKLMDSEIVYASGHTAVRRVSELKSRAENILKSEKRFVCAENMIKEAKRIYADAMLAETMAKARMCAFGCISLLLDAVMVGNGKYFHKGIKRTFEELDGISLPDCFINNIYRIVTASEMEELRESLTVLLRATAAYAKRDRVKEQPSESNISGTYEEMFSNWRNKMAEAAERDDVFSSFMNMASLQFMMDEIAEEVALGQIPVMDNYNPADLAGNAENFDDALHKYLQEYKKAGICPKHYADVEEFIGSYLDC